MIQNRYRIPKILGIIGIMILIGNATFSVANVATQRRVRPKVAPRSVVLTKADMALIAADQQEQVRQRLATDESSRSAFAKDIRTMLAVAEEARRTGIANREKTKRQMDFVRAQIIAEDYYATHPKEVTEAEIVALFKEAGKEALFEQLIADALTGEQQTITPAQKAFARKSVGRTMIGERRGVAAGVVKRRIVKLKILLYQARALAQTYTNENLREKVKPTEAEIDAYLASHPDSDLKDREQAEAILKRLREGEDFAALARQFSADGSRANGGDLGWFGRGAMVTEFENATFALKPGQVSELVKTVFGYHIIKLEERRTVARNGVSEEEVRARHILINSGDPLESQKPPRDRARDVLQKEKQQRLVDEIVKRSRVIVPPDFPTDWFRK